jgi:dienelactone hydrolase
MAAQVSKVRAAWGRAEACQLHSAWRAEACRTPKYVELNFGHADHGFFCDQRASHDAHAAKEAWAFVTTFLEHHLVDD